MSVIKALPCGCIPTDTDPTNPHEGTLQNPLTVKLCGMHAAVPGLVAALERFERYLDYPGKGAEPEGAGAATVEVCLDLARSALAAARGEVARA